MSWYTVRVSPSTRTCVILGAGFSRAVSPRMPLTDELGGLALQGLSPGEVPVPDRDFANGYFEAWLSRLAEPQPDLRYAENLRNQASFAMISEAVREVLVRRQTQVMASPPPRWLERFLRVAQVEQLTVLTFNYDTLVEAAVDGPVRIWDWAGQCLVDSTDLVDGLPAMPQPAGMTFTKARSDSFRLLKLHGSIDCWWVNGDATGATIVRTPGGWKDVAPSYARQGAVPGRAPFLVPPAAGKSWFFQNPLIREVWQRAAAALQEAPAVAFLGYSFPLTDLVTSGMVADRLGGREVLVEVVNRSPGVPLDNLCRLGVPAGSSHDTVETYVHELERMSATRAAAALADLDDQLPVLVATEEANLARVTACHSQASGVRLVAEPFDGWSRATRSIIDGGDPPVTVAQLRRQLAEGTQLNVAVAHGEEASVIGWEPYHTTAGYAAKWAVGILSAAPPRTD